MTSGERTVISNQWSVIRQASVLGVRYAVSSEECQGTRDFPSTPDPRPPASLPLISRKDAEIQSVDELKGEPTHEEKNNFSKDHGAHRHRRDRGRARERRRGFGCRSPLQE